MTNGAYIAQKLKGWGLDYSADMVELELNRLGLSSDEDVAENLDLFFYRVLPEVLLLPSSVSEGGFSISYDRKAVTAYYKMLAARLGKPNLLETNTIKDITGRW